MCKFAVLKNVWLVLLFVFIVTVSPLAADEEDDDNPFFFGFDRFHIDTLPGGGYFPTFFESYAPDVTFLNEESNAFAYIDPARVYFEGDSYLDFQWNFNDFNINSALSAGSPALRVPTSAISGFNLRGEAPLTRRAGMQFRWKTPDRSFQTMGVSTNYTDLGTYSDWAQFFIFTPASTRDRFLYNERRKSLGDWHLDYLFNRKIGDSNLMLSLQYFDIQRQFNDFNTFDATFMEDAEVLLATAQFRTELDDGYWEIIGMMDLSERTNLGAETGLYPQETMDQKKSAFLGGVHLAKESLDLKLYVQQENETLLPYELNFGKDLLDNDGDGLFPYGRFGEFSATTLNASVDVPLEFNIGDGYALINAYADLRYSRVNGDEDIHQFNPIFANSDPYQVIRWDGAQDYHHINTNVKAGVRAELELSDDISIESNLFFKYSGLSFQDEANNLSFANPGFDVGIRLFKGRKTQIQVAYGVIPYDINPSVGFFLQQRRPYGGIFGWSDINGDGSFQPEETGELFGLTGGRYHLLDEDISTPVKKRFLLNIFTQLSKKWSLHVKGIYKINSDNYWVKFRNEYGFYENVDGVDVYFFDTPYKSYYLSNYAFEDDPFYAQLLLHLKGGEKEKWFFSFSFMAHIGMGATTFGNGVGSNDIGVISESQANPNSHINAYGRLDGDRAFVGHIYAGFYLFKKFSLGVSLKYRDGQPFAFFNATNNYDQWALYYQTIKAEDEKGIKGGPREDYLSEINVRLNYHFRLSDVDAVLSLEAFNIVDVGYELSEHVFYSTKDREAVELNIPKSFRLSLKVRF